MIGFAEAIRLVRIQERLRNATWHEIRKDGHHKSSEGAVTIAYVLPPVVGDEQEPYWAVELWSYVLGPHRSHRFSGRTAGEAISKAEDAAQEWCMASEMEQFDRAMNGGEEDEKFHDEYPSASDHPRSTANEEERG